jgi:hypothetical protein
MLLSNYILNGGARPYLEYGWVTAPNTAGQSITANTITTLTIDTEIADTGNNGSISGNQITLAAGTYYFESTISTRQSAAAEGSGLFSLYNITNSSYITRGRIWGNDAGTPYSAYGVMNGQFTITSTSVFDLRILTTNATIVDNGALSTQLSTLSTAGADQRTTIKLWKLA